MGDPDLPSDASGFFRAAGDGEVAAVEALLDRGFPVNARDPYGSTALHEAAYAGRVDLVRLLLDRGAELDARDGSWDSTPLCFATVGSGERGDQREDPWIEVVRLLLAAGADRNGVWVEDKPPGERVAAVLAEYGITEPEIVLPDPEIARDLADRLAAALRVEDEAGFRGLLHPEVRWGTCRNRDQVIDWYRSSGVRAEVRGLGFHKDAIVIEFALRDSPEPAYVAFRVTGDLITEIRGFPAESVEEIRQHRQ